LTRARLNRSRTRAAPTPTIASTNSEPLICTELTAAFVTISAATHKLTGRYGTVRNHSCYVFQLTKLQKL
jgi:hypothetical protein